MFIGHWAPALALADRPNGPRLATLFVAGQLLDWGFFTALLLGWEHMRITPGIAVMNPMDLYDMPLTHSLLGAVVLSALFAAALRWRGLAMGGALVAGGVVLSHWLLDLLVHVPDLTLAGQPPKLGFGLWNHPRVEMPLELGLVVVGLWFYVARARPPAARLAVLVAVMALLQGINWYGPVDTQVTVMTSVMGFIAYALPTLAAWWTDRAAQPGASQP